MKKILITGSTGFLGTKLVNELKKNTKIIGLSNNPQKIKSENYTHIKKNIQENNIKINSKISTIIHLAAVSDVRFCNLNPNISFDINVKGTEKMLELCRKKDTNFIFASSSHVYGKPIKNPISENEELKPHSIYASDKIIGETLCETYAKIYGLDISVLRFFSIYGPDAPKHNVINNIIKQQLTSSKIKLGNIKPERDFIFVDDVINAIKLATKSQKGFNVFNIGSGKSFSIKNICEKISKILKNDAQIEIDKEKVRKDDIAKICSNNKKIKKMYNWKPEISIENGLKKTCQYYQNLL